MVYFLKIKDKTEETLFQAGKRVFSIFSDFFGKEDSVALKVHFGERNNITSLNPCFVKAIYQELLPKVKYIALVDCTVLYKSERSFGPSYVKLAKELGFDFAPIEILDGKRGKDELKIEIRKSHFKEIKVGAGLKRFSAILAISHFTGHSTAGFGGAIKNIGMGLGSKAGKLEMHKTFQLKENSEICIGCGTCVRECPGGAIELVGGKAKINYSKCLHCGFCISICPVGAIEIPWESASSKELQERIAEYAFGILKDKKSLFINLLLNITKRCDCVREPQKPFLDDIGILISEDPVAIDKASLDLAGIENFKTPEIDPEVQVKYGKELGLGSLDYKLEQISL